MNDYFKGLRGWKTTEARGINDFGQIVVYATNGYPTESKSFLITPKINIPILISGTKEEDVNMDGHVAEDLSGSQPNKKDNGVVTNGTKKKKKEKEKNSGYDSSL